MILYEYPFNERIRTYLRLEQLFRRLSELIPRSHPLDHHFALTTLFEIMDVAGRADLKSDLLKDIEKQKQLLESYRGNPAISESALNKILGQLERCFTDINDHVGKAGQALTENTWLMNIRKRIGIPGGTCSFDIPSYHGWQHHDVASRQQALQNWSATLMPLAEPIYLLLRLLRDSGFPQKVVAENGVFQQNLPQGRTFQMLRLAISPTLNLIPEISANHLVLAIRLMRLHENTHLLACPEDSVFELALCA